MPTRAVHVDTGTLTVDNRFNFTTVAAVASQNNINPRWIGENDWAVGQGEPADGAIWDGNIPALFTAPSVEGLPGTIAEAAAAVDQAMMDLSNAQANLNALPPIG